MVRTDMRQVQLVCGSLIAGMLLLSGCATTPPAKITPTKPPIDLKGQVSAPIAFHGVVASIPAGTQIGTVYFGILNVPVRTLRLDNDFVFPSNEFNLVGNETLKAYGYNVLAQTSENMLFGKNESGKASYWLGGTIKGISNDEWWIGDLLAKKEVSLTVDWQVLDTVKNQVVFKFTSTGDKQTTIAAAFRVAMFKLLAEDGLVAVVTNSVPSQASDTAIFTSSISIANSASPELVPLPDQAEKAMTSVVVVLVGGSLGSGVLVSSDGYILTAAHVVSGVKQATVKFKSGLTLNADVLRVDERQDVALLKVAGSGHPHLRVCKDDVPSVGSDLFAIGAPQGEAFAYSVTKGVVSGNRVLDGVSYIQTDASINKGNSGGPLLSKNGQILGVVSWKVGTRGVEGMAFGVPVKAITKSLNIEWK